ncbi:MAG: ribonuclease H family protein [Bacteroidetes bacterium]|nr:ribonuclease H family protein [Bacteroidota bacterium]
MAKQRFYVVWEGRDTGVFEHWKDCEKQIKGFTGAKYKSFPTRDLAEEAFHHDYRLYMGIDFGKPRKSAEELKNIGLPVPESISVDAACSGNPGVLEYRGVDTGTGAEIFRQGPFDQGTINIGEFLAIVHALAFLKEREIDIPVYSDSRNAIKWVKDKEARTKLLKTDKNQKLLYLLDRAVKWLHANDYPNPVLKWETSVWGEIPADFGRK